MGYFLPFHCPNSPKNENWKKKILILGGIIILHKCIKTHDHILHCSLDMVRDRCNYFSFWAIFCHLPPLTAQKIKFQGKKNTWIYHFTHVYQKLWLDDVWFLRYGVQWTDGWKKWQREVSAPPRKNQYFEKSATLFGMKKIENCKPNSLIQTLIYRSNIHYSKIYQREDWKNNSLTWKCGLGILDIDTQ